VSDIVLEYTSATPRRFKLWQDVLRDVGFARDYGPAPGQPGYDEHQQRSARAVALLQPHLDALPKVVDAQHPHVLAMMESIVRSLESARQPAWLRELGDVSLDLSQVMDGIEVLLLDLIGPEGQSPVARGQVELPTQPYFTAWLVASTGCPNLVPSLDATQAIGWRTDRAYLYPAQAKAVSELEPRDVTFEACCDVLRTWNARSSTKVWIGSADPTERHRYDAWQAAFTEGLVQLQSGLAETVERGEIYLGWTTWYGYE
jgi:hypothetical protein